MSFEALSPVVPEAIIKHRLVINREKKVFCKKTDPNCLDIQISYYYSLYYSDLLIQLG